MREDQGGRKGGEEGEKGWGGGDLRGCGDD